MTAAAKRKTRRASGAKKSDVPLIVDSEVHVMRDVDEKDLTPAEKANFDARRTMRGSMHTVIPPSVLVDDTDLEDEEIDDLRRRGVIRPAKPEEIARAENKERQEKRATLEQEQQQEMAMLIADQQNEKAKLQNDGKLGTAEAQNNLSTKHAKAAQQMQEKHSKALASFDAKD